MRRSDPARWARVRNLFALASYILALFGIVCGVAAAISYASVGYSEYVLYGLKAFAACALVGAGVAIGSAVVVAAVRSLITKSSLKGNLSELLKSAESTELYILLITALTIFLFLSDR